MKSALPHRIDEKSKATREQGGALLPRYSSHDRSIDRDLRITDYMILDALLIGFRGKRASEKTLDSQCHRYFENLSASK